MLYSSIHDHTNLYTMVYSHPTTEAETWDLGRGPRLYAFPTNLESALGSLASTLLLFEPTLTQGMKNY